MFNSGQFPAEAEELLRVAVDALPLQYQHSVSEITLLDSESNVNFCLTYTNGEAAVLRLQQADSNSLGLDISQELEIQRRAIQHDLAPELLFYSLEPTLVLTRFVNHINASDLPSIDQQLGLLAQKLPELHGLPQDKLREFKIEQRCFNYFLQLDEKFSNEVPGFSTSERMELQQQLEYFQFNIGRLFSELSRFKHSKVLCHNDLNPKNFIFKPDGGLYFIDFEYSAVGDPLFDFALLSQSLSLTPQQLNDFLQQYNQRAATDFCLEEVELMQPVVIYLQWLWYLLHDPMLSNRKRLQQQLNHLYSF